MGDDSRSDEPRPAGAPRGTVPPPIVKDVPAAPESQQQQQQQQ